MGLTANIRDLTWDGTASDWDNTDVTWDGAVYTEYLQTVDESAAINEDLPVKSAVKAVSEQLAVNEGFDREFIIFRDISETVKFMESAAKDLAKNCSELIGFNESITKNIVLFSFENLNMQEAEDDPTDFKRHYYETISIAESVIKRLAKNCAESVGFVDLLILPFADGVVADLAIKNRTLEDENFELMVNKSSAFGFSDWIRFQEGEYSFREAIIRFVLENYDPDTVTHIQIPKHVVTVDVKDIIDRGSANISGVTRVFFNKKFHAEPVVVITSFVSSDFIVPEIIATTKEYFDVQLKKADGTTAAGQINWQAHGY
ncbi:hypothetical protein [Deferribacter abyssi]|uniref:hypothetical protein n=1 Tax=Deferribacter abyssi TaxID=213806 RepID=UPI003C29ED5F